MYAYAAAGRRKSLFTGEKHTKNRVINMKIVLPEKVNYIIRTLTGHGYEAYAVGGCVRDSLLFKKPKDWDITTSAKPVQVKALFGHTIDTGIVHGTVTVMLGRDGFEVTTYRIDGEYEDARHPKEVRFTPRLSEDLRRRDFTMNAMAYNDRDGLIDLYDGAGDLKRGMIRCVGNPEERFREDALRMLRAVRFAAQLDFSIEETTKAAIGRLAENIRFVSAERISAELLKLLMSEHPEKMREAYETGLTGVFFPEFDRMMKTPQNNPHHCFSVGEHTIEAVRQAEADKITRLTMLLHDIAKPACRTVGADGTDHFYGHEKKGSEMAKDILRRLKFDNATTESVCRQILCHDDRPPLEERAVRRAVNRNGTKQYPRMFAVKRADILAQSEAGREEKLSYVAEYEKLYQKIVNAGQCLSLRDLAVTGNDLIAAGMKPGREIGEALRALLEFVLENPEENTKEKLLKQVHKMTIPHI